MINRLAILCMLAVRYMCSFSNQLQNVMAVGFPPTRDVDRSTHPYKYASRGAQNQNQRLSCGEKTVHNEKANSSASAPDMDTCNYLCQPCYQTNDYCSLTVFISIGKSPLIGDWCWRSYASSNITGHGSHCVLMKTAIRLSLAFCLNALLSVFCIVRLPSNALVSLQFLYKWLALIIMYGLLTCGVCCFLYK